MKLSIGFLMVFISASLIWGLVVMPSIGHRTGSQADSILPTAERVVHDVPAVFGAEYLTVKHEVPIINNARDHLRFAEVRASCGCSKAQLGKMELSPGEETKLRIDVELSPDGDNRQISCFLTSESGRQWVHLFNVKAYPLLQFDGRQPHVSFGEVGPGDEAARTVGLRLHAAGIGAPPPTVVSADSDVANLNAVFANSQNWNALSDGSGTWRQSRMDLQLRAPEQAGDYSATVVLHYRGKGIDGQKECTVAWRVRSFYDVVPKRIALGTVRQSAETITRSVRISRSDGQPLEILSVRVDAPQVKVASVRSVSETHAEVEFEVDVAKIDAVLYAEAKIITTHPRQPKIAIPLSGRTGT